MRWDGASRFHELSATAHRPAERELEDGVRASPLDGIVARSSGSSARDLLLNDCGRPMAARAPCTLRQGQTSVTGLSQVSDLAVALSLPRHLSPPSADQGLAATPNIVDAATHCKRTVVACKNTVVAYKTAFLGEIFPYFARLRKIGGSLVARGLGASGSSPHEAGALEPRSRVRSANEASDWKRNQHSAVTNFHTPTTQDLQPGLGQLGGFSISA